MNFFEHQERARRNTRMMVLLYVLAVIAVVLAVDLALAAAYRWSFAELYGPRVPRGLYVGGAAGTLLMILAVSLYHLLRLRKGGEAIARMVGARRVSPDTRDALERRLLNVVEEMAIAAGTRVPAVYVMQEEAGINAFAAGHDLSNAVIAVTRGALQTLNRDELQGVIGHEYSHILNGDMSLNVRMLGVLGGIVFIGSIGRFLMHAAGRGRKSSGGVVMLGVALFAIGYIGLFFARLIKSAIARQREFLADASSVQFTRNPSAIAGALDQIRASSAGTAVVNRYAEDLSHMFFARAVSVWLGGLFETHPPVEERIRRVLPGFGASDYRSRRAPGGQAGFEPPAPRPPPVALGQRSGDAAHAWGRSAAQSVALVGLLEADKVAYAQRLVSRLPPALRDTLHRAEGAPAVIVAMMLAGPAEVTAQQLTAARATGAGELAARAQALAGELAGLGPAFRLPLIDLALPAAKAAPEATRQALLTVLQAVIQADRRVTLHEFVVLTLVRSQLAAKPAASGRQPLSALRGEVLLLLSLLAHSAVGAGGEAQAQAAFRAGAAHLGFADAALAPRTALSLPAAGEALEKLAQLAPLAKRELVAALFAAISADGKVRVAEAELMRLVGATLGCPVPPLFDAVEPDAAHS